MNDSTVFLMRCAFVFFRGEKIFGRIFDGTKTKCPKRLSVGKGEYQRYMVSNPSINFYARSLDEEHHVVKTGIRRRVSDGLPRSIWQSVVRFYRQEKKNNNNRKGNHIFHASLYFSNVIKL